MGSNDLLSVCIIGSGNWGSAISRIVGGNVKEHSYLFNPTVNMWVFEEEINGEKLSEIINTKHENVKYLPGKILPNNVVAVPRVALAAQDCDILVFVVPHQFIPGICKELMGKTQKSAIGISLVKGPPFDLQELGGPSAGVGIKLISEEIGNKLNIPMAVLMGANLAPEVAADQFCEATIGCGNTEMANKLKKLFNTPNFQIHIAHDAQTVELCGALKNIVACGAGFVDGLGYGGDVKVAVMRLGLLEMAKFIEHFYPGSHLATFFESCGVADLITTCYGGRNRKVAVAFVKSGKTMVELEAELLGGQKLAGPHTAEVIYRMLQKYKLQDEYPLFVGIHRICIGELTPEHIIQMLREYPEHTAV